MTSVGRLDVLGTTRAVVRTARDVRLDTSAIDRLAMRFRDAEVERPAWRIWPHYWDDTSRTANYLLVLDALNFSFWGTPRWRVSYQGGVYDGYWALAVALRRGIDEGWPLFDARELARLQIADVAHLLRGEGELPMLAERTANLREVGQVLVERFEGSFANAVQRADGRAMRLTALLAKCFSSFDDRALYQGSEVQFFKRAQILVSDLFGAFNGQGLGRFDDLNSLTAFADYKLPQTLREDGVLVYSPALETLVDAQQELAAGDPREVEIRVATVWAVELLRQALSGLGRQLAAFELDWLLWSQAQSRSLPRPYHRTRTIFY